MSDFDDFWDEEMQRSARERAKLRAEGFVKTFDGDLITVEESDRQNEAHQAEVQRRFGGEMSYDARSRATRSVLLQEARRLGVLQGADPTMRGVSVDEYATLRDARASELWKNLPPEQRQAFANFIASHRGAMEKFARHGGKKDNPWRECGNPEMVATAKSLGLEGRSAVLASLDNLTETLGLFFAAKVARDEFNAVWNAEELVSTQPAKLGEKLVEAAQAAMSPARRVA